MEKVLRSMSVLSLQFHICAALSELVLRPDLLSTSILDLTYFLISCRSLVAVSIKVFSSKPCLVDMTQIIYPQLCTMYHAICAIMIDIDGYRDFLFTQYIIVSLLLKISVVCLCLGNPFGMIRAGQSSMSELVRQYKVEF
jgi:hypothetical protein